MLSRPDFAACPLDQVDKFKGSAARAVPKLQHLPRWGLPPGSLPSPAGNNSARSTIINTARSVVINGGAVGHKWPQADVHGNGFAGKASDAAPCQREDLRKYALLFLHQPCVVCSPCCGTVSKHCCSLGATHSMFLYWITFFAHPEQYSCSLLRG